jgi:hypothetical protein
MDYVVLGRVLPHPSAVFHAYASVGTQLVARALPHYTPMKGGRVSFNSLTHEATQFADSICLVCVGIFQMLIPSDRTNAGLNRHWWVPPPWSCEFQIIPLPFLPVLYSPLSPNCPARSPIMPTIRSSC